MIGSVENIIKVQGENTKGILQAFSMVDAHQQVLSRVARDLAEAVAYARSLQVDGDVTLSKGDLGNLKFLEDGHTLNMRGYYDEYQQVGTQAGEHADRAVLLWSEGTSAEDAVDRAKLEAHRSLAHQAAKPDQDYEVEFFGGNSGQDHHQQNASPAQENG